MRGTISAVNTLEDDLFEMQTGKNTKVFCVFIFGGRGFCLFFIGQGDIFYFLGVGMEYPVFTFNWRWWGFRFFQIDGL